MAYEKTIITEKHIRNLIKLQKEYGGDVMLSIKRNEFPEHEIFYGVRSREEEE